MTLDIKSLKLAIATCGDFGTSKGGLISYTYAAIKQSLLAQGMSPDEIPLAKRTFGTMRELGFEKCAGNGPVARYAAPLLTVVGPIIAEAAQSTLAKYEASK